MKNFEPTLEQWQKIDDAIDDMIAEDFPTEKLMDCVIDNSPTSTFFARRNNFDGDRELELEFGIRKARAQVEIKEERKKVSVYIELECVRAMLYDCDKGDIELPKEFCDKITVNMKPITYGS